MVRKVNRISLVVFLCFLIVASVLVYFKLEWVEKKTDVGPVADVKRQKFYAVQRFLETTDTSFIIEQGYTRLDSPLFSEGYNQDVYVAEDLKVFPSTQDLIVISDGYGALSELRSNKLLDWVKAGGGLVVTASNPFVSSIEQRPDYIFDYFGVSAIEVEYSVVDEDETESESETSTTVDTQVEAAKGSLVTGEFQKWNPQAQCDLLYDSVPLTVYNEIEIAIGFKANRALSFEEDRDDDFSFWSSNSQGVQIAQANYGEGAVTFITDTTLWKNDYIACLDNAYFIRFFVGGTKKVWLFDNHDSPSLVVLIWTKLPYFVFMLVIFVGVMVWHFGQRFGTITPLQPLNRRKILEHIEASALFLWRHKTSRWLLVETVQHSIRKKMKLRNGNFDSKSTDQQIAMIAQSTQLPIEEVKAAMVEMTDELKSQTLSEQNFIILMKSLKRIEGKL